MEEHPEFMLSHVCACSGNNSTVYQNLPDTDYVFGFINYHILISVPIELVTTGYTLQYQHVLHWENLYRHLSLFNSNLHQNS